MLKSSRQAPCPQLVYFLPRSSHMNVRSSRWPWLLHHIAKEYRDSPEDKDTDVLAVNVVQVLHSTVQMMPDVRLISISFAVRGCCQHQCAR